MSTYCGVNTRLVYVLNVKVVVATFNQKKASDCENLLWNRWIVAALVPN